MIKQHYKIKGLRPFVFTRPTQDKAPKTDEAAKRIAMNRVYENGEGLFSPNRQIKASVREAVSITKMKIEKSNKRAIQLVKSLLMVEPKEICFNLTKKDVKLSDPYPIHLDNGGIVWGYFGFIESGWELEFDLLFHEMLEPEFIKEALEMAGLLCGIGGKRPEYGRFEII